MNRTVRSTLTAAAIAAAVAATSGGVATAAPQLPQPLISQLEKSRSGIAPRIVVPSPAIVNAGTVTHVSTVGNTATIVITTPDHGDCNFGVFKSSIAGFPDIPQVDPTLSYLADIPGPDLQEVSSPSLIGTKYFPTIPATQLSPHTIVATLPSRTYTVYNFCDIYASDGVTLTAPGINYLDEFTLPSTPAIPRFGSS